MISLGQVFKAFKGIAGIRPEKITLQPFTYSKEIADEDEQNLLCVETQFPSKPDIPTSITDNALASWRESCQMIISGISIPVGMEYIDAKGQSSKRQVDVKKIFRSAYGKGPRFLSGFCYLREQHRTFSEERIRDLTDLETGEIYDPPKQFFDKYGIFDSPRMEELQIIIHILSFLAHADRFFADEERDVIAGVIAQYCSGRQMELVRDYAFTHRVKKKDFLNEVSKLEYLDERTVKFIIDKATELTMADNVLSPKEKEFMDILKGINS